MPPLRQAAAPAGADTPQSAPAARLHASPKKQVKLHRFAKAHKYDVNGARVRGCRALLLLQSDACPPAGCPIYTRNEVLADTLVHVVGVPFGIVASYLMLEEVHARLPQVRGSRLSARAPRCAGAAAGRAAPRKRCLKALCIAAKEVLCAR